MIILYVNGEEIHLRPWYVNVRYHRVTEFWSGFHCHYLLSFRFESEKWVNFEIIVGIPSVLKAIILGIQDILEDFLEIIEMPKRKSIVLHNYVTSSFFLLYFVVRYPITLLILAYQLSLNLIAVSHHTFCQLILSYMIIHINTIYVRSKMKLASYSSKILYAMIYDE